MRAATGRHSRVLHEPLGPPSGRPSPLSGSGIDTNDAPRKRGLSNSDLTRHRLGVLGTVRTEVQVRPHDGFASGEIQLREEVRTVTDGAPTKILAKPPAWTERPNLPCFLPRQPDDWTDELRETHWDTRSEAEAAQMCAGCPVQRECLDAALLEERGLDHRSRFLVRGGLTPKGRWSLDVAQTD